MYALIRSGRVVNIIIADAEFAESLLGDYDNVVSCGLNAGVGYLWNEIDGFYPEHIDIMEIIEEPIIEEPVTE